MKTKVLIAEDTEDSRIVLERLLASQGFEVASGVNGLEALQLAKANPPDIIISDILMPEMDGFELCRQIKRDPDLHKIPFVFYTATYTEQKDRYLGMALGAALFVLKPVSPPQTIIGIINDILAVSREKMDHIQPTVMEEKDEDELDEMHREAVTKKLNKKINELEIERTALKKSEIAKERLLSAIEQVAEAIIITDIEGTILYVNPAFEQITGYTSEEATGKNPRMLKSELQDDVFYKEMWDTLKNGNRWQGQLVNKNKNGTFYTEELSISMVHDSSGTTINYVAVMRDITEKMKIEEQLHQAQKLEAIGTLAGGVAHDFNNLLMGVMGYVELCLDKIEPDHPIREWLDEIIINAQRSAALTRQLLAFARKQTVSPKVIDLNDAVTGMVKMLRHLIGENIDLVWIPQTELWSIKIDPSQVDQILANLTVNARDAIGGVGKLTIETANVSFDEAYCTDHIDCLPGMYAMLAVSDNGKGMDHNTLDRIFDPFFTTKAVGMGTGLGLATLYGIVKQNGGFVNVYSEPEKGTTFRIYLSRHIGSDIELPQPSDTACPHGNETILLTEDEKAIRITVAALLRKLGYTVLVAEAPEIAIQLDDEHDGTIHLLITDVVMPGMNGRDLANRLTAQHPEMKCLFMSGYTANVIAHQGILDNDINFLSKPFTMNQLGLEVRRILDSPQLKKDNCSEST